MLIFFYDDDDEKKLEKDKSVNKFSDQILEENIFAYSS